MLVDKHLAAINRLEKSCDSLGNISKGELALYSGGVFKAPGRWAKTKTAQKTGRMNCLFRTIQAICLFFHGYTVKKCVRVFNQFKETCKEPLIQLQAIKNTNLSSTEKAALSQALETLKEKILKAQEGIDNLSNTYKTRHATRYQAIVDSLEILKTTLKEQTQLATHLQAEWNHLTSNPVPIPTTVLTPPTLEPIPSPSPSAALSTSSPILTAPSSPLRSPLRSRLLPSFSQSSPLATTQDPNSDSLAAVVRPLSQSAPPPPPFGPKSSPQATLPPIPGEPEAPEPLYLETKNYKKLTNEEIEAQCRVLQAAISEMGPLLTPYLNDFKEYDTNEQKFKEFQIAQHEKEIGLQQYQELAQDLEEGQKNGTKVARELVEKVQTITVIFYPDQEVDQYNQHVRQLKQQNKSIKKQQLPEIEENQKFSHAILETQQLIQETMCDIEAYQENARSLQNKLEEIAENRLHDMSFITFRAYIEKKKKTYDSWHRALDARKKYIESRKRAPTPPIDSGAENNPSTDPLEPLLETHPEFAKIIQGQRNMGEQFRSLRLKKSEGLGQILTHLKAGSSTALK